jgi:PAS domain S-box-containing protein
MTPARIVIVEDEFIVAADLRQRVQRLGYHVVGVATSGEEAVCKIREVRPDLILLDIQLGTGIDGVTVAHRVLEEQHLPIVFMTAYSDNETLQRAKLVGPCGYVLKPFEERELRTTLEMALYKHQTDRRLRESEERYRALVEQTGEGIAYLTREARFEFANAAAEGIFGVVGDGLSGRSLAEFTRPDEFSRLLGEVHTNPHAVKWTSPLTIDRPDGARRDILVTTTAARDAQGAVVGVFVVFRDMTGRPDPGKVYCANGRMLPEISLLDEAPSDGRTCPLAAMRPAVEGSLMDMQSALGDLLATPLSVDQKTRLETLQHSVEQMRQLIEKGLMHLHLGARFIRLSHAGRSAAERVPRT